MRLRVAPLPASSGVAGRPSFELPRRSCPSALPVAKLRSPRTSLLRLRLPIHSTGCPAFCIFRLCRRPAHELPRSPRPSALQALAPWVAPRLRTSRCASRWFGEFPRAAIFRLCLGFKSSGCPAVSLPWRRLIGPQVASVPAPSGLPSLRLQVSLNPASTAGSMMTSRFSSNFASSAGPRMNLRDETDCTNSPLTLDAISISLS